MQQTLSIVRAFFPRLFIFLQYVSMRSMTEVRLPSPLFLWILVPELSRSIGFLLCSNVQQSFPTELASSPIFGHLFPRQKFVIISTTWNATAMKRKLRKSVLRIVFKMLYEKSHYATKTKSLVWVIFFWQKVLLWPKKKFPAGWSGWKDSFSSPKLR